MTAPLIARGDSPSDSHFPSPLVDVTASEWTAFVRAMRTADLGSVSASNALGMFEMKPRRLAELGVLTDMRSCRSPAGRRVHTGTFVLPMTERRFLADPGVQYDTFKRSMAEYSSRIRTGDIALSEGVSLSGALAILHRSGTGGLAGWADSEKRFSETVALWERAEGIF